MHTWFWKLGVHNFFLFEFKIDVYDRCKNRLYRSCKELKTALGPLVGHQRLNAEEGMGEEDDRKCLT